MRINNGKLFFVTSLVVAAMGAAGLVGCGDADDCGWFGCCDDDEDCGWYAHVQDNNASSACASSAACVDPDFPNCDTLTGACLSACYLPEQCIDPAQPNCNEVTGRCVVPCATDTDCSPRYPRCDAGGLCTVD